MYQSAEGCLDGLPCKKQRKLESVGSYMQMKGAKDSPHWLILKQFCAGKNLFIRLTISKKVKSIIYKHLSLQYQPAPSHDLCHLNIFTSKHSLPHAAFLHCSIIHPSVHRLIAYSFRIMISFLAALRTFLPSFLRNFLQTNTLSVCLSFARHSSQNSFLRIKKQTDRKTDRLREAESANAGGRMKDADICYVRAHLRIRSRRDRIIFKLGAQRVHWLFW